MRRPGRFLLAAAALAVFWERLWRRLWPAACVAGMFVAVSLLDVLPRFPGWLHGLVLLIFAVLTGGALFHAFKGLKPVDGAAARRRLEKDNGLEHRPLRALEDNLAAGSGVLWRLHLERMAGAARALRVRPPSPGLAKHDPYGLRAAVVLFLAVGLTAAGGEAPDRLKRALSPNLFPPAQPPAVEAWITPPEYTGRPRIYLANKEGDDQAVAAPVGGALRVQVGGAMAAPRLKLEEKTISFESMGRNAYKAEAVIDQEDRISVEYGGGEIASWTLSVIPDALPSVALLNDPAAPKGRLLRLAYEAGDDYGVTEVAAVIRLSGGGPRTEGGTEGGAESEIRLPLPLSGTNKGVVKGSVLKDLTAHAWAGLPATLTLEASDARGQTGESEAVDLVLPGRVFNHPVARAIIEARKKLSDTTLEGYEAASADLEEIARDPERFSNDTVIYLALMVALARLDYDRGGKAVQSVREILWGAALRLEDGGMSIAEDNLRKARERLMQALRSGAGEKDIEALMDRLQQALGAYLSALRENFEKLDAPQDMMGELSSSAMAFVEGDELQSLIGQARELLRTGDVDAARRVLSELDRILGNIQAGLQSGALSKEMAETRRFLDEARRLGKRQQKIVDDTFERMRKDQEKRRRAEKYLKPDMGGGGLEQDALRRDLNKLMEDYGELMGGIPRSLGAAELDMREALNALGAGLDRAVLAAQSRALEKLREGAKEMGEQLAKRLGGMRAKMMMGLRGGQGGGRDPFGRWPGGQFGFIGGSLELPARMDVREAGKILEELRRRAGQRRRGQEELDYIKRLLKLF